MGSVEVVPRTLPMSPMGPGCVKTCTRGERAELFSLFSSSDGDWQIASSLIERNRDKLSTRKFGVGVFTQPGSKTEVAALERHVRSTLHNRHRLTAPPCPFRARNGLTQSPHVNEQTASAARRGPGSWRSDG